MDTSDRNIPLIYTGYINDIYDEVQSQFIRILDTFEWDEDIIYIVHIHIHPVVSIDVFERNESGTPLNFLDENDDLKVLSTSRSDDLEVIFRAQIFALSSCYLL